jgi:hypothetical protein
MRSPQEVTARRLMTVLSLRTFAQLAQLLMNPNAPSLLQARADRINTLIRDARDHQTQLESWENEGGST